MLVLGLLIGAVLGLTGAGGGMLAVPALMFGQGWSVAEAAPAALLAVAAGAWLGTLDGLRHGLARYRAALLMAAVGLPFGALGLMLAGRLSPDALQATFAVFMLVAAVRLLRGGREALAEHDQALCRVHADTGRLVWTPLTITVMTALGALAGLLSGLLGVGGGFVLVPLLARYTELSLAAVVATSLMVVALTASLGAALAVLHGSMPPASAVLPFTAAVLAGMWGGRRLSARLRPAVVMRTFAMLLLAVALAMLASRLPGFGV